jgi:hypothetical protein
MAASIKKMPRAAQPNRWFAPVRDNNCGLHYVDTLGQLVALVFPDDSMLVVTFYSGGGGTCTRPIEKYHGEIRKIEPGEKFEITGKP